MVVQNFVTISVVQIGSHARHSKALNRIRTGQHLLAPAPIWADQCVATTITVASENRSISPQNTLPVSIMVSLVALWVDQLGPTTPALGGPLSPKSISLFGDDFMASSQKWHRNSLSSH